MLDSVYLQELPENIQASVNTVSDAAMFLNLFHNDIVCEFIEAFMYWSDVELTIALIEELHLNWAIVKNDKGNIIGFITREALT